ncbi:hypothetical protein K7432_014516 [Basidiobolus ranarum]|uniref:Uncharacterized protein n=1 Tax=Basidiobolus ranarum TaxID=34480 RepID=A0ABR2VQ89_9FUNG
MESIVLPDLAVLLGASVVLDRHTVVAMEEMVTLTVMVMQMETVMIMVMEMVAAAVMVPVTQIVMAKHLRTNPILQILSQV